jgi:hypothetical protein
MKKILLCAAMAMLALVGCEKAVQSELSFDDVKDFATVTGKLVGYVDVPGQATVKQALAGVRVYVEVPNDEYRTGAEGNRLFEGKTDEEGNYSIKVALGTKGIAAGKALLKWDDFHMEIAGRTVYFQFGQKNLGALNKDDFREDEITIDQDAVLNSTVGEADLQGVLTYDAGAVKKEDGTREEITHAFAADVQVSIAVVYFAGQPEEVTKVFVTKTDKDGKFAFKVPVEAAGNNLDIDIAQFKANYTRFANNQWITEEYYYTLAAPIAVAVKANEIKIQDVFAGNKEKIEPTTKTQVSFNVVGTFWRQFEKPEYDKSENLTGYSKGLQTTSDYKFTIRVDYYDAGLANIESTILYEGLTPGDKGAVSQTVKLYDGWDINRVKVSAYADKTVKVTAEQFAHYYLAFDEDSKKYATAKDGYTKQKSLQGVYKGGEDNPLCASKWADEKQLFFDLNLGDLVLRFEPENEGTLMGIAFAYDPGDPAKLCDGTDGQYYFHTVDIDGKTYAKGIGGLKW